LRLKTLLPYAFGKFHKDAAIELAPGLNMIRGDNESGKSTLGAFIIGMLYGFKKDGKTRISRSPEFDRYRPWSGSDYRGAMTYEEGGRVYRVERSFDPDAVKILDDATGEDLTRQFSQDSRKEYDFAQRHLGLSQKEFRNTVWIGQLGSAQEPGLGTEIQGKLESILEGGAEDVSLGRALAVLSEEKAKIKAQRSTKAKLDLVAREIDRLEQELAAARAREEQVRDWLVEASSLSREKAECQEAVGIRAKDLRYARYGLLKGVLSKVEEIDKESEALRHKLVETEWAGDLPSGLEQSYWSLENEIGSILRRIEEVKAEARILSDKRETALAAIGGMGAVEATGVDEVGIASLHSRYGLAKAQAMRGERTTNEARRELRSIEEEGKSKRYPSGDLDEDVLRMAEDHQRNCELAEKEKDRLVIEAERARAAVSSAGANDSSTLLYAIALVVLGLAVVFTVMARPYSIPLFAAAVVIFGLGIRGHSRSARIRSEARQAFAEKEQEVESQIERIESVKKILSEFLYTVGARSVEELRSRSRDVSSYQARLKSAKDRFEQVQKAWFEASSELSAIEKEMLAYLRAAGIVQASDPVTDAAVDRLRKGLRDLQSRKSGLKTIVDRASEVAAPLSQQETLLAGAREREAELLRSAGVESDQGFRDKVAAKAAYDEIQRTLLEMDGRRKALLSGRDASDIRSELWQLAEGTDADAVLDGDNVEQVTEREYEDMRKALDEDKGRLSDIGQRLAGIERGIRLRNEEGRPVSALAEELGRLRGREEELALERDALELAHTTLLELSTSIRREFAPALNARVGAVLEGLTCGRYAEVKVSPDLEMSVIHPDTKGQAAIASLSSGTLDQCYFALRVAIAEAITKKDSFPLFLDDSFAQYDDRRLEGALRLLSELSAKHQILVFSCHDREEKVAGRIGLSFNRVAL